MATLLDILGGLFISGFLLLIALTASDTATTEFFNYNSDAIIQQNLSDLSDVIQYDLRKMGFGIPEVNQNTILQIAQPNHIKYLSQLNMDSDCRVPVAGVSTLDNIPDTIEYNIDSLESVDYGDTSITTYTIRRTIKITPSTSHTMQIGVIGNNNVFRYLNQIGDPAAIISATKMVEVTLTAFNPRITLSSDFVMSQLSNGDDPEFRKRELRRLLRASYWRQTRLISKNLRR